MKPRRPSCEAVRNFLREYNHQKELTEKWMNANDTEINDEEMDSEDRTMSDDDDKMMTDEDGKQEPPDDIKLVMQVGILHFNKNIINNFYNVLMC